eukprot:TRINITY_DN337_c0_g1_i1.p1 TRINITY_DN337_c0_g1~~TRINITY_DN337_c0_g1_i1.p1  ORF type:complete len:334 (+),score=44.37 TRINITY_DN337_c0_g1_i1:254-1255(+)
MVNPAVCCKAERRFVVSILHSAALVTLTLLCFAWTISAKSTSNTNPVFVSDSLEGNVNGIDVPRNLAEDVTVTAEPLARRVLARHPKGKGMRGHKGMHKGMKGMHGGRRGIVQSTAVVTGPPSGLLSFDDFDVDYGPERVSVWTDGTMSLKLDQGGGVRLRSKARYQYGTFSFDVKSPWPDTNGVVSAFYLSSRKGAPMPIAEEIDWEFKRSGKYTGAQMNFFARGIGGNERQTYVVPGYESFTPYTGFNTYSFEWTPDHITFYINGDVMTKYDTIQGGPNYVDQLPIQPMYIYISIWKAKWTGDINWGAGPLSAEVKNINAQPWNLLPSEFP